MTTRRWVRPFALLLLAGCIPQPAPTPTPAAISTAKVRVATATPKAIVRAIVTPSPHATPYVFAKPKALPKILAINISTLVITSGETVSGSVETTSNVASVEARIAGWSMSLPRTRIGHFEASGQIPDLGPWIAKGSYTLEVIARNADGVKAERDIAITLK